MIKSGKINNKTRSDDLQIRNEKWNEAIMISRQTKDIGCWKGIMSLLIGTGNWR